MWLYIKGKLFLIYFNQTLAAFLHLTNFDSIYFSTTIFLAASKTHSMLTLSPNSFSLCSRRTPWKQEKKWICVDKQLVEEALKCTLLLCNGAMKYRIDYLFTRSDDKHPSQDETFSIHVALVTWPPGPYKVLPDSQANETKHTHLPLLWPIKSLLCS